jgi:hypothetical protein
MSTPVEQETEVPDAQLGEHVVHGADHFGVGQHRGGAQRVQVALGELAEAAPAGPVRAPHRADHVALVGGGQLAAVRGGHPGQRDRHVIPQGQVGFAGGFVLTTPQDLEDELVALFPVLAQQHVQPLERRGLQRLKPVPREDRTDDRERALPRIQLGGEEITCPRRGIELRRHAPMLPDNAAPRHIDPRASAAQCFLGLAGARQEGKNSGAASAAGVLA